LDEEGGQVKPRTTTPRRALIGAGVLAAALAIELVDELVDGVKGAALPLIRHDLALSYGQIGLLASVPLVAGSMLELPIGVLVGEGRWRRRAVLAGGIVFVAALLAAAAARSFTGLLVALVAFFPASGAFVGLTESGLMDADPGRRTQHMARWTLAGSVGSVAGPLLLVAVLGSGGTWRIAYLLLAGCAAVTWLGVVRSGRHPNPEAATHAPAQAAGPHAAHAAGQQDGDPAQQDGDPAQRGGDPAQPADPPGGQAPARHDDPARSVKKTFADRAIGVLRQREAMRWVALLQIADLLLDVLTGFLAVYLVDVVHATPAQAALGVTIRLAAGLAGDVVLIQVLERAGSLAVLQVSAVAAAALYPGFLLVPGLWSKLLILTGLSIATAPWYPVMQARLYRSLPGQSGLAVSLTSAASMLGGLGPVAIGFLAQRFGLAWALAGLMLVPVGMSFALKRRPPS
jgi:MFS transporter, FSR family, fosmidomycin resistance protein